MYFPEIFETTINGKLITVERTRNCYGYYHYKLYIDGCRADMRKKKLIYAISHEMWMYKYDDIFFGSDICGRIVIGKENEKETRIVRKQLEQPCNWWLTKTKKLEDTYYIDNKYFKHS